MNYDLLIISDEPSPYAVDLHNAISEKFDNIFVCYPNSKSWSADAGHNYISLPPMKYKNKIFEGRTLLQKIGVIIFLSKILLFRPKYVLLSGYYKSVHFISLYLCFFLRLNFFLFSDRFNNDKPTVKTPIAFYIREFTRKILFKKCISILTCGKIGIESTYKAGCPRNKILNFPYVVSIERLNLLSTQYEQEKKFHHVFNNAKTIFFFSGRHIERKGLDTLLYALQIVKQNTDNFFLIIEGDGPLMVHYQNLSKELGFSNENVVFLGFQQMEEHAYLLKKADIIVIPSKDDPWGIVVHEGMLMGKIVCASDKTESAIDRIIDKQNGYIFEAKNYTQLSQIFLYLLENPHTYEFVSQEAFKTAQYWSTERNADILATSIKNHSAQIA